MRFKFEANTNWCSDGRLLFNIETSVANSADYLSVYPHPPVSEISLTFVDKHGSILFEGTTSIISKHRINIKKELKEKFEIAYGRCPKKFQFYENKPHQWIAKEL